MGKRPLTLCAVPVVLVLGTLLLACARGDVSSTRTTVCFGDLIANPQRYAGLTVCTEGIQVEGFEASGLAAAMVDKDGYPQLSGPVIWVEGADVRWRADCTRTETNPPFEFCRVLVCGVFETSGGYGHGGGYAYQLSGREGAERTRTTATLAAD